MVSKSTDARAPRGSTDRLILSKKIKVGRHTTADLFSAIDGIPDVVYLLREVKIERPTSNPESRAITGHFTFNRKKIFSGLPLKDS